MVSSGGGGGGGGGTNLFSVGFYTFFSSFFSIAPSLYFVYLLFIFNSGVLISFSFDFD